MGFPPRIGRASSARCALENRSASGPPQVPFLKAAVAYYASLGVTVTRVMTDNGSCYWAFAFCNACRELGLRHIRTRPYSPKTNGNAERFIQTARRECVVRHGFETPGCAYSGGQG